jgi:ribosomal protein S18 acetylase RimI-like enzyme
VLLTEERLKVLAPMIELDAGAAGTFYINDVAVFPAYRHAGIGRELIELAFAEAKKAGLSGVSLTTFEEDRRLVDYYRGFGFSVVASRPIVSHECIEFGSNLILMICPVR